MKPLDHCRVHYIQIRHHLPAVYCQVICIYWSSRDEPPTSELSPPSHLAASLHLARWRDGKGTLKEILLEGLELEQTVIPG